jgi:hypothetical protein
MRLDYLYSTVNYFVIVESLDSHSKKVRKDKYVFEENIKIYEPYMDKIIYLKIDNLPFGSSEPWKNENYQKNYCENGFKLIPNLNDNDWILFSDVDEIPNKDLVKNLLYYTGVRGVRFDHKLFYYNVNVLQNQIWGGTVGVQKKCFISMMNMRSNRCNNELISFHNGGWHYSYMGGAEKVFTKMQSYAESDDNINHSSLENIRNAINTTKDILGRTDNMFIKNIVDINVEGMAPSNMNKMLQLYPYLLKVSLAVESTGVNVSYVCLIYKSTKWLQFVYDQVMKFTNLENNEFFFVANDAHPNVLKYLKDKNMPHYIYNGTEEQQKEWYINNVYRAYNYGGKMAKGKYIVFINSDMAFTPSWDKKLLESITDNTCVVSRLVERGILRSGTYGIEKNFGDNYDNYRESEFIKYAVEIGKNELKDQGLFMPLLIKKEHLEKVGYYPEGNIIVGSDLFNPVYAKLGEHNLISGDNVLMMKLKSIGVNHKTHFDSIVYHFQQGEMLEPVDSIIDNKSGWLINDCLTCIPGTKTFWHFLLDNIDSLMDKTGGYTNFETLPGKIENEFKKSKPKYIIRNATYFRKLNIDGVYTISILQDNQSKHAGLFAMQKDVLKHSNLVICNSKYIYEDYKDYIVGDYKIIPLGVDFDVFKPCGLRDERVLPNSIVYIGSSMVFPKGFDRLLKIMKEMIECNFCLIMKDEYSYKDLPDELKGRVVIFNSITEKEIVPIINSCVMSVCTSYMETQHLSGIECAACSKPMVATNVGWYNDLSHDMRWGRLSNDSNFVDDIRYVMNHLDEYNPRECLKDNGYDLESCRRSWVEIVGSI